MALNLQGTPNTRDYLLGRGALYLAQLDPATGLALEFRHLGNAPSFALNLATEEVTHKSSLTAASAVDKRVVTSQQIGFSFEIDEALNFENLALFLQGTTETVTNPAVAGVGTAMARQNLADSAVLGRWYDLRRESDNQRSIFSVNTVPKVYNEDTMMLAVLGTDYTVEIETGRVFILSTATGISAGDELTWYSAADASAPASLQFVHGLKDDQRNYALKYVAINASNNSEVSEVMLYSVSVSADGDFGMIGDEFARMSFTGLAQQNSLLDKIIDIIAPPAA
jgi:hypothetical protein